MFGHLLQINTTASTDGDKLAFTINIGLSIGWLHLTGAFHSLVFLTLFRTIFVTTFGAAMMIINTYEVFLFTQGLSFRRTIQCRWRGMTYWTSFRGAIGFVQRLGYYIIKATPSKPRLIESIVQSRTETKSNLSQFRGLESEIILVLQPHFSLLWQVQIMLQV